MSNVGCVSPPNFVRLKRSNRIIYLHCDFQQDSVQAIKERIEKLTGRTFYAIRLYLDKQNLDDALTLAQCGVDTNGTVLIVVSSKGKNADGEHVWEGVEEALKPPPSHQAASTEVMVEEAIDSAHAASPDTRSSSVNVHNATAGGGARVVFSEDLLLS